MFSLHLRHHRHKMKEQNNWFLSNNEKEEKMKRIFITTVFLVGFSLIFAAGCSKNTAASPTPSAASSPATSTQPSTLPSTELSNPWTDVKTTDEAAKTAKLDSFDAPERIGDYKRTALHAMSGDGGVAEAIYENGNDTLTLRKGHGSKDISGDFRNLGIMKPFDIAGTGQEASIMIDDNHIVYMAYWGDGGIMYAITSDKGIAEADLSPILKMIYSI